jgi:hypothetical protein
MKLMNSTHRVMPDGEFAIKTLQLLFSEMASVAHWVWDTLLSR